MNRPDSAARREFEFWMKRFVRDERRTVTSKVILQDRCVTYGHARRKYNKQSLHNIQSMCNLPSLHGQRVLVCRVGFNGNGNGAQRQKIACLEVNLIYLKAAVIGFFHEQGGFSNQIYLYTAYVKMTKAWLLLDAERPKYTQHSNECFRNHYNRACFITTTEQQASQIEHTVSKYNSSMNVACTYTWSSETEVRRTDHWLEVVLEGPRRLV